MLTNSHVRPLWFTIFGILSFIATLGSSAPLALVQATQTTNDIGITMSEDRTRLVPGGRVTFTVRMTNHGPDAATFVDIGFKVPARLKIVSMACDFGISPDGSFCEYSSLPIGATAVSRLVATTSSSRRPRAGLLRISSAVSFEDVGVIDPELSNNTATVRLRLIRRNAAP